jgi:hypothetical protein
MIPVKEQYHKKSILTHRDVLRGFGKSNLQQCRSVFAVHVGYITCLQW